MIWTKFKKVSQY